ncbi:MAG: hypothetical protein ABI551_01700 [Polyangiaceae bacterium]
MSLSREEMMQVMSYADGELEGASLARAEALVDSSDDAALLVRELRTLGDCVRIVETERSLQRPPLDIVTAVMADLDRRTAPVGSLAERRRNAIIVGTFTGMLALAAGWFLVVHNTTDRATGDALAANAGATPAVATTAPLSTTPEKVLPEQTQAVAGVEGVDIESVESPSHDVSVFYVPATANANSNASSVVVWIGEDEAKK